ncbi:MAG: hypothetical protein ACPGUD_01515 [Parashewanella sp.]
MKSFGLITTSLLTFLLLQGCNNDSQNDNANKGNHLNTRFLYTSTNDINANQVIQFNIADNGSLIEQQAVPTGGVGDADDGDFDTQGAIRIIGDKLLVVNAGESVNNPNITTNNGSISVFDINNTNGTLTRIDQRVDDTGIQNMDSFGKRPVSIDFHTYNGTTWVVVANQQDVSHCVTPTAANTLATCLDQYGKPISEHLADPNPRTRNIHLFKFNQTSGVLTPIKQLDFYTAKLNGPAQVAFSPNGKKLAVTTLGIGNVGYPAKENLSTPAHTFLYDIQADEKNFSVQNRRYFANKGILASIGFSWSSDSRYLYVSNALLSSRWVSNNADSANASLISLDTNDSDNVFNSDIAQESLPSGTGVISSTTRPAACWTWLSPDNKRLYSVDFNTNKVINFGVNGNLLESNQTITRKHATEGDSKDIYITANQKRAYVLSFKSHAISIFDIDEDGLLTEKASSPLAVKASVKNGIQIPVEQQFFIGIAGYPNTYIGF